MNCNEDWLTCHHSKNFMHMQIFILFELLAYFSSLTSFWFLDILLASFSLLRCVKNSCNLCTITTTTTTAKAYMHISCCCCFHYFKNLTEWMTDWLTEYILWLSKYSTNESSTVFLHTELKELNKNENMKCVWKSI